MFNQLAVVQALKAWIAGLEVIEAGTTVAAIKEAFIGLNETIPSTPCAAVIIDSLADPSEYSINNCNQDIKISVDILILVAVTRNLEADETELLKLTDQANLLLVDSTQPNSLDPTLGGLVGDTAYQGIQGYGVAEINSRAYRTARLRFEITT